MRIRLPAVLAVAVLATACIQGLETPNGRFGTLSVPAWGDGGGGYVMAPEAAFYGQTDLSYQPFAVDTCIIAGYSPSTSVNGSLLTLNAGEFIFTNVSGHQDTLAPVPGINFRLYQPLRINGIPYTPGDTLSVTVPGWQGGFPASAISVRTAEPFTHGAIGVPAENIDLPLTWTAAGVPGSQMTFSLRYKNATATTTQNEQVFCSFVDDGAATIKGDYLNGWRTALNNDRSTRAVRVRWKEVLIDSHTRLSIISSFGQPLLTYEP